MTIWLHRYLFYRKQLYFGAFVIEIEMENYMFALYLPENVPLVARLGII